MMSDQLLGLNAFTNKDMVELASVFWCRYCGRSIGMEVRVCYPHLHTHTTHAHWASAPSLALPT